MPPVPYLITPVKMRSSVLFPAPFAPTKMTFEFGGMTQFSPEMFGLSWSYEKFRFWMLTTGLSEMVVGSVSMAVSMEAIGVSVALKNLWE